MNIGENASHGPFATTTVTLLFLFCWSLITRDLICDLSRYINNTPLYTVTVAS